jgi:hypothetical protein
VSQDHLLQIDLPLLWVVSPQVVHVLSQNKIVLGDIAVF